MIRGQGGHGSPGPVIIDTKEMTYTIEFLLIPFCSAKCWPTDVFVPIWVEGNLLFGEEGTFLPLLICIKYQQSGKFLPAFAERNELTKY